MQQAMTWEAQGYSVSTVRYFVRTQVWGINIFLSCQKEERFQNKNFLLLVFVLCLLLSLFSLGCYNLAG